MKTILGSTHQRDEIYQQLLQDSNQQGIAGVSFFTVEQLTKTTIETSTALTTIRCAKTLQDKKTEFPIYGNMFQYPAFINEVVGFARTCASFGITKEDLPEDTAAEKELRNILDLILQEPLNEAETYRHHDSLFEHACTLEDVVVYPTFFQDISTYRFLQELKQKHPSLQEIKNPRKASTIAYRYALSTRQELEALAQEICANAEPCNVVLCNFKEQFPVLKQVFTRYNIPFHPYRETVRTNVTSRFIRLVQFAMQKDTPSLLTAFKEHAFIEPMDDYALQYLEETMMDISIEQFSAPTLEILQNENSITSSLHEQALSELSKNKGDIHALLNTTTPQEALYVAYAIVQKHPCLENPLELQQALQMRRTLNQTIQEIQSETDLEFLFDILLQTEAPLPTTADSFCLVSDLTHPLFPRKTTYVLGCSGRNYPGVPVRNGLFDEPYVAKIATFPSFQERHTIYMNQLDWISHSCDTLIYSYATNDYQGREIQPSYFITSLGCVPTPWPFIATKNVPIPEHTLSPDTAKQLFVQDDQKIHGSISRIERYFQCPYSYFLQSGLKVRPQQMADLDAASIGTLTHATLENIVNKHGQDFADITSQEIHTYVDSYFDELQQLHPKETKQIEWAKERLTLSLLQSLTYLHEVNSNTLFKPIATEQEFHYDGFNGIALYGIIDRIDSVNGKYRVIDYKSSKHSLSEKTVKSGTKLQLLTYMIAASIDAKTPAGTYYFSFQPANTELIAGKVSKKAGITFQDVFTPSTLQEKADANRKLYGWTFEDPSDEYTDFAKYYTPGTKQYYDLTLVKQCMEELYQYFRTHVLDGKIEIHPVEGACTFCDYLSVCRYHDGQYDLEERVMKDVSLKQDKGSDSE